MREEPPHHSNIQLTRCATPKSSQALHHLSTAISTALWLGLDRLTPSSTPMHDLAFSQYPLSLAYELSKRLFHMLSFLDGCGTRRLGAWRLKHCTTPLPGNYTDEDLSLEELPPERPVSEVTAGTMSRVGAMFGDAIRMFLGAAAGSDRMFSDEIFPSAPFSCLFVFRALLDDAEAHRCFNFVAN